jgi:hypothetical protein
MLRALKLQPMVIATAVLLLILADPAAGSNTQDLPRQVTVRDSAGVEIVEIPGAAIARLPEWRLGRTPVTTIGNAAGAEQYLFGSIADAILLPDGRIAVADGQAEDIRVFSSDGVFEQRFGGKGEGPGEFRSLELIGSVTGGRLAAWDHQQKRVTVFGRDGGVDTTWRALACPNQDARFAGRGCMTSPVGFFSDGSMFVSDADAIAAQRGLAVPPNQRTERLHAGGTARIGSLGPEGWTQFGALRQGDLIFVVDSDNLAYPVTRLYGGRPEWAVHGSRAAYAYSANRDVHVRDQAGAAHRIIRLGMPLQRVDRNRLDALRSTDWSGRAVGPKWPQAVSRWIDNFEPGPHVPFIGGLMLDQSDRLWIAEYSLPEFVPRDAPRWWTIFAEDGRPLARIQLRGSVMDVSADAVLIRSKDELDVQRIEVYRIETAGLR